MEHLNIKQEEIEDTLDEFNFTERDLEIIKDEELVAKLCTEEIHIKEELEDVPNINECGDDELIRNIFEDQHREFSDVKMAVSLTDLPGTSYSTEATANGECYNYYDSRYFKRKSSDQETSANEKYFRGFANNAPYALNETEHLYEVCRCKNYFLNSVTELSGNNTTHTGQRLFKCYNCKFSCSLKRDLISHMEINTNFIESHDSNYRTDKKSKLVQHIRNHTDKKTYACNVCSYRCAQKSELTIHVRRHTEEKPYACIICSYKCSVKSKLTQHNMQHHTGERPYACNICGYKCVQKGRLDTHIRTHIGEKSNECNICSYKCAGKSHLTEHMRRHTGEKPYACDICSFKCSHKLYLPIHMRRHTGEKPYACDICSFKCSHKLYLPIHMRRHTGEKPYACDICSYKCAEKSYLTKHIRRHTGERPYACNICSYKSASKGTLNRHTRIHTG